MHYWPCFLDLKFSVNGTHLYHVTILKRAARDPPTCVWFAIYDYFPNHDWFVFTTHSFFCIFIFLPPPLIVRGEATDCREKERSAAPATNPRYVLRDLCKTIAFCARQNIVKYYNALQING